MICHLYRGHWEMIVASLDNGDSRFAEAVRERVSKAIEECGDAICVAVEGKVEGFRMLADKVFPSLPEIANVIRLLCAAADAADLWDEVEDVAFINRRVA